MDDSHQQHHKESQLHPRLLVQKPLALPTLLQENSLHLPCPFCLRILRCSLGPLPAKWHWQTRKHPETWSSLHQPKLQRLLPWMCHQHAERPRTAVASKRRKQQQLTLFFKRVWGLTPAIPAIEFLTPINSKRQIKPRNPKDFKTTNIVTNHTRNNSQSCRVDPTKTVVYRYSFFPGLPSTGTT